MKALICKWFRVRRLKPIYPVAEKVSGTFGPGAFESNTLTNLLEHRVAVFARIVLVIYPRYHIVMLAGISGIVTTNNFRGKLPRALFVKL